MSVGAMCPRNRVLGADEKPCKRHSAWYNMNMYAVCIVMATMVSGGLI